MTTSLNTLIFDVDGTLAETEREGHRVAFNRAFSDAGLNWYWSEALYGALLTVAGGKERIRFFIERYQPMVESIHSDIAELSTFIAELYQAKTSHYAQLLNEGAILPRPGVIRLIHEARDAGMRLAIATTSAPQNAIALLKMMLAPEAPHWFEVIAAGDIVSAKKPAPDIYQYVLRAMNVKPEECVAFEDSAHGLRAAVQVGLPTIVTMNDYTRTHDFSDAAIVVNHLGDPNHPAVIVANTIDLPDCLRQSPIPYVDLARLRHIHRQALLINR
ncbi:MAG: HAD-IA family hydrolase [Cyanobacteria bacterium P01_E01_bin.6]